ncbi:MAG: hypothetical protein ACYCSX_14670 [Acidimicrobiales bacterium]|jgi:hypothetical protein
MSSAARAGRACHSNSEVDRGGTDTAVAIALAAFVDADADDDVDASAVAGHRS